MLFGREKVKLLHGPTPLEYLPGMSEDLGVELYMKRDDLTPLGGGGNKIRKLEYSIKEALDQKATMIFTVGGVQTNHGRQTAAAAAKFGLKCVILTMGRYPGEVSGNLLLDRIFGAEVIIAEPKELPASDFDELAKKYIERYEKAGEIVYYMPLGGSDVTGTLGYYECAKELTSQSKEMGIEDARVVTAAGSFGTFAGLYLGLKNEESPLRLTGIAIMPFEDNKIEEAMSLLRESADAFGLDFADAWEDLDVQTVYSHGSYNNPVKEVRDAICHMARREGILLDPCYTGKSFAGLKRMIEEGKIQQGEKVIFIHTGGMPGLYTKHHREAFEKELMDDGIIIQEI